MRKKPNNRPKASLLTKAVILVLLLTIGWQLHGLRGQILHAQEEKEQYAARVASQEQENAALRSDIAEGPTSEKLEEIARDKLGRLPVLVGQMDEL